MILWFIFLPGSRSACCFFVFYQKRDLSPRSFRRGELFPQMRRARVFITTLGLQDVLLPPGFCQRRDDNLAQRALVHVRVEVCEKPFPKLRPLLALFEHVHIQGHDFHHLPAELAAREHRAFLPVVHVEHILCKVGVVPRTELAGKKR